ncbi:MAG TPA: hypothetical protein VF304_18890 [Casimicrobiaceae bacterium]
MLKATVQVDDARLRVTAQVVDLHGAELIHSFIAECDARDVLELEDDIAQRTARALRVEREARAALRHPDPGTRSVEARVAFERGRARFQRWRADDGDTAVAHFRRSVALDPTYARAYAWQALADYRDAVSYKRESRQTAWQRVLPLFERALAIDPNLGEAHAMRAFFDFTRERHITDAELRRGIALSPDSAESYTLLAQRLASSDIPAERERESLEAVDRAIALAPETTRYRYLKALILWRDPTLRSRAIDLMRSVLESDPDFAPAAAKLGQWTWQELLQPADAARWSEHALHIDPDTPWIRESLCRIYLDMEDAAAARDVVAPAVPEASSECRTDLALAAGDWRRAAQIAFNMPGEALFGDRYGAGWMGSLARYARETGDSDRVLALLETLGKDRKLVASQPSGFVEPSFLLIQLDQMRGDRAAADRLLDALWQWLPEFERMQSTYYERYPLRAMLLAWSGRNDEALDELLRWTRRRHSPYWWYVFERDATWEQSRQDPRFIEAHQHERDYAAGQRAMLDTLRRQGAVPMRGKEEPTRGVARTANR